MIYSEPSLKQSPNDVKKYQTLTLENGLRVLLIENATSNKAAAALAVNVGHFSDPNHRQGMAHFLEHMLFLGTRTYPDGSEYQKFISQFGGTNNAWTATEHTCFFFDINHQQFEPALDRFSRFFSEPLLSQASIESERQNIDAEFKLKLKDDVRRLYDVHKETINPAHPFAKFSVGNNQTLADTDDSQIRDELHTFFTTYYCAPYMTLVLESPFSLSTMEKLSNQFFTAISSTDAPAPTIDVPLYLNEHQQKYIQIKPVKDDRQLIISFAMPSIDKFYRHKAESLIAHILGHEGAGSMLSLLKNKQWALGLSAGSGINGSNFKDFNLSIPLTKLGEQHIDDIISLCFSYITLLKNKQPLPEHYYQDKKVMSELSFQYLEKQKPLDSVSQLVINMQHYPKEDYVFGDYVMDGIQHDAITELLSSLTPSNMRVVHISQANTFNKVSKWYQVPYSVKDIPTSQILNWQKAPKIEALALPKENPYIVAAPKIYPHEVKSSDNTTPPKTTPELIHESNGINIWFKQDNTFEVPKGYIYISIDSPFSIASTENIAMLRLFTDMYSDSVLEENYNAELAGIHYHLYSHQGGITLQVSGLSEKQPQLLSALLKQLTDSKFTEQKFTLLKQQLISHWSNSEKSKSISQVFACLNSALQPKNPSNQSLCQALTSITFNDFCQYYSELFAEVSIQVLIHGNWQRAHALEISFFINERFNQACDDKFFVNVPSIDIQGMGDLMMPLHIPDHDPACVVYFPLPDKSLKTSALTMITSQLLSPDFFEQMRTNKQYGYLVGISFIPINRYPGIAFYIQSPHTPATTLLDAINAFIENSEQLLNSKTEHDWQHIQQGLAAQLTESDTSLRIRSQRFWSAICNRDDDFSQKQQLIDILLSLKLSDMTDFIKQYFVPKSGADRVSLISSPQPYKMEDKPLKNKHITTQKEMCKLTQRKY